MDYKVIYAFSSGSHLSRIKAHMEPDTELNGCESFQCGNPRGTHIRFIPIDIAKLSDPDEFTDLWVAIRPDLTVFVGNGLSRESAPQSPSVSLCSRIWWPVFSESDNGIRHLSDKFEEVGRSKRKVIEGYASNVEWHDWYRELEHNDSPNCQWTEGLLLEPERANFLKPISDANAKIGVVEPRRAGHPRLRQFRNCSGMALFAPAHSWNVDLFGTDILDEIEDHTSSIDAIIALVNYIASSDREAQVSDERHISPAAHKRLENVGRDGKVIFEGNALKRRITDLLWISDRLPDKSVDIIRSTRGSVKLELQASPVDSLMLDALFSSGVFEYLAEDRVKAMRDSKPKVREYRFSTNVRNHPIYMIDFVDDIERLGKGIVGTESVGGSTLPDFKTRWTKFPRIAPLAELIGDSRSLDFRFSKCG